MSPSCPDDKFHMIWRKLTRPGRGAIAGATIGGIAGLVLFIVIIVIIMNKNRK